MRIAPVEIDPSEERALRRFAWYPRRCPQCDAAYWLEWVTVYQRRRYFYSELTGISWPFYTYRVSPCGVGIATNAKRS